MKKIIIDGKVSVNGKKSIVKMDKPVEVYTKTGVDSEIKEIKKGFIPLTGTEDGKPVTGDIEFDVYNGTKTIKTTLGSYIEFQDDGTIEINNNSATPNVYIKGIDIEGTGLTSEGISSNYYYGANYTDTTYVQKKYVDDNFAKIGTTAPTSATDTGTVGEIRVTATYIYTCVATDTWVRAAVATW